MATFVKAKDRLLSRFKSLTWIEMNQRFNHTLQPRIFREMIADSVTYRVDVSNWRKTDARKLGIYSSMIPHPSWIVLKILRNEGFQSYLVGGCVRDLLLNKTPKDFDVITTANLTQVRKQFHRCEIVGQRFPICRVHIRGSVIEVSSFETVAKDTEVKEKILLSQAPHGCDEKDLIRWRNSMHRDFTINSLFYDPFLNIIYDYADGMKDLRSLKLRTLIPAYFSFKEDCARILRGIRIAARLGMSFSKDTETAIRNLSSSVDRLDKFRIMMELNYMMSYGAALPSICLLRRYDLLKIFLPFHAAYLDEQASETPAENSMMLMKMLFNLDKLVSCDRPADCILWVGLLAFHQALVSNPQDAFVIWVFASVLYNGKWEEGVKFARQHAIEQVNFAPEVSGFSEIGSDEELAAKVTELASLVQDCVNGFTLNETHSYMEFVSMKMGANVGQIFDVLVNSIESYDKGRTSFMIDYYLLGKGHIPETRFVLGKIILETISGGLAGGEKDVDEEKEIKSLLDSVEESCHPRPCDLTKNEFLSKKNRKHSIAIPDWESNLERTKKQMLSGKKFRLSEELNMNKQDEISKEESHQKGKELPNLVDTCLFAKEETKMTQENISETKDFHSSFEEVIFEKINEHKNVVKEKKSSWLSLSNLKILGKTILKTISGGLLGEREVDEEKKTKLPLDSVEESCHPRPCDLTKNEFLGKKIRKHSLAIPASESNHLERTKKQKLSGKKCRLSEQELNMNKQDEVSKEESHQKGNEHRNLVETCQLAKEETKMTQENISEKKDCHSSLKEVISKKINKHKNLVKEKNSSRLPLSNQKILGKINLKTISGGLLGGERDVDEEKKTKLLLDSVEESCHPRPCDLTKTEFLGKKIRKHSLAIPASESNHLERTKKHKLSGKKRRLSEQELNMNKQDEVSKEESHQKGNEHRNLVETCQLAKEETKMTQENISEKKDCHSSLKEVISKKINKHKNVVKERNSSQLPLSNQKILGKINLKTISGGLLGGERDVDEEKKTKLLLDSVEESCHPRPCDLTNNEFLSMNIRKHSLAIPELESNLERTKKQKLAGKKRRLSEQELNMNKQDGVSKEESHQKGKELQNLVETCLLAKEETKMTHENISEKKDCHSSLEEVISKKINEPKNVVKEKNGSRPPLSSLFR